MFMAGGLSSIDLRLDSYREGSPNDTAECLLIKLLGREVGNRGMEQAE